MSLNLAESSSAVAQFPDTAQKCTIAAGCFWGVEKIFQKQFGSNGLLETRVGYIGGDATHPSYRAVCTGRTGRMF
jgi:peptide-methionine (S)-S-oxide reductase